MFVYVLAAICEECTEIVGIYASEKLAKEEMQELEEGNIYKQFEYTLSRTKVIGELNVSF